MHATLSCSMCHINGTFVGMSKNCASCHLPTFEQTTTPNHVSAGFPTDCSICHNTSSWAGAVLPSIRIHRNRIGSIEESPLKPLLRVLHGKRNG
jgi:hypothetical protein